jgi:16S rRNA (cytidine1402-2'-O)-methyltransferase
MPAEPSRGVLHVVATPIGNLDDITLRAIRVLRECDRVLAEDTRHSGRLLAHLGIEKPLVSAHGHNERGRIEQVLQWLAQGERLALISDAGTPGISDPGGALIAAARDAAFAVTPIPGPSAFVAAASASGLPSDRLVFLGFLPGRPGRRKTALRQAAAAGGTITFYASPHRLKEDLTIAASVLPPESPACVARELTKVWEQFDRGTLSDLAERWSQQDARGEICVLVHVGDRAPA